VAAAAVSPKDIMEDLGKKEEKKKGFFAKFFEKLDKKLEEKSRKPSCCGPKKESGADFPSFQNKGNQCRPSHPSKKENKDLDGDSCCS
jgi:hypothetical protein